MGIFTATLRCYPTIADKDFLLWLLAVTSNEVKMLPIGLWSLGVYYVSISSWKDCTTQDHKQPFSKESPGLMLELSFEIAGSVFYRDEEVTTKVSFQSNNK